MNSLQKMTRAIAASLAIIFVVAGGLIILGAPEAMAKTLTVGTAAGTYDPQAVTPATVAIPIKIDDPSGVGGIAFTLTYNPAVFRFVGLEQAVPGATMSNGDVYKVPTPATGDPTYYNPYVKEAPYQTANYTVTGTNTLFFQHNDVAVASLPVGRVLVAAATATPLPGTTATTLFNARFAIIGGINGTAYPIQLLQSIINNPPAGYITDTFLPVLVGTGTAGTDGMYASLDFPLIPATLVAGSITVTAPTFSLGGKVTYAGTGANASGCTVTLQKETAVAGVYAFNGQTTTDSNGNYAFAGRSAGNFKVVVISPDPTYNGGELAVALSASKADANIALQPKPQPARISGSVSGYIPGLQAKVVDGSGNVMGIFNIASDGTWSSALMPAGGTYTWFLTYGSLSSGPYADKAAQPFDAAQLKSISGTITGTAGAGALTAASVAGKLMKTLQVTANGAYTISNLVPADDYVVSFVTTGQPVTYYNGKTDVSQAAKVNVSTTNAEGIDFTFIPPAAHITGAISDAGGAVAGKTVYGFEVNTFALVQATIAAGGTYDLTVKPGTYEVFVIKGNGNIFYFYNTDGTPTQTESNAALVAVADGATAAGTNIVITEADKTLTGQVTYRTSTGSPAPNVLITASSATQRALGLTGQDGKYTITGLVGGVTYTVAMKPLTGNYAVQTATIVAGTDTTKDFIIDTGVILSGTVTDSQSTNSVGGAMLFLKDQQTGALAGGRVYFSAANGTYSIGDIRPGSYTLEVTHPDYQGSTTDIVINEDKTQNVALQKGGYFKGTVVDGNNANAPLVGVTVIVTRASGTPVYTVTNSSGAYSVYGLDQTLNDYMLIAQKRGYERQVKILKQPATTDTAGNTVDFTLAPPVTTFKISGAVTKSDTTGVSGAIVIVASQSKNFVGTTTTDGAGAYAITGLLNAADYKIVVIPGGNLPTQAATFTVSSADVTRNFTIQLGNDIGGTISGPLNGANTYVFLYKGTAYIGFARTTDGSFLFKALTAGQDYKVLVVSAGFSPQWYTGQSSINNATAITTGTTNLTLTLTAAP